VAQGLGLVRTEINTGQEACATLMFQGKRPSTCKGIVTILLLPALLVAVKVTV
jgi:hypothetical protein